MTSINNYEVTLGFWTNWSYGKIQGATITLTRQNGGFLVAFLAIFVGMVGKSFWRLGCFTMHRCLSSAKPQDGLYHQRQAIFRNSDTAQDGMFRLLTSMFAWRSDLRARKPILRLLPVVLAAFTISVAFGLASIFSSNVTSETLNQVLLRGSRCGLYKEGQVNDTSKLLTLGEPYQTERVNEYLNYGMQCYTDKTHTDGCNLYIKSRLPLVSTRGKACPFGADICKLEDDNLVMDTGMLDSLEHFGINTAPTNRFQLRLVTTCAPLKTQGYTSNYNDSKYGAIKRYMYGNTNSMTQVNNFTYELPVDHIYRPKDGTNAKNIPRLEYQLGSTNHFAGAAERNAWTPIDALNLLDADVHIFFKSAPEILYTAPVTDPWFSAQKLLEGKTASTSGSNRIGFSAWGQDEILGVMACTEQVQYCNPNLPANERCEPLRGTGDPRRAETWKKIFRTKDQLDMIHWVDSIWILFTYSISTIVVYIGASALRARYSLSMGMSGPLPDNQWQLEAEHLTKGRLASLQAAFVEAANGIPEALEDFRDPPFANETMVQKICANQKIVSNNYSSFNVLGVSIIMVVGMLIIILDLGLEPAVVWWQRRKYRRHQAQDTECGSDDKLSSPLYSTLEWSQTSTLQLQRLAHESAGYGDWSGCDQAVPVTGRDQLLACVDFRDLKHPRFQSMKPTSITESEEKDLPAKFESIERTESGESTSERN